MTCDLGLILELAGGFSATALAYLFREFSHAPCSTTGLLTLAPSSPFPFPAITLPLCSGRLLPQAHLERYSSQQQDFSDAAMELDVRRVRRDGHGAEYGAEHQEEPQWDGS